jgi:intracellular sulfur oxidation DsrE/DsrF family protein
MKYALVLVTAIGLSVDSYCQSRVYPLIRDFGGIFAIQNPEEKPDPSLTYNIVIEVEKESDRPDTLNWALNNVARLLNLHAIGGVPAKNVNVVLAIHGGATYTTMDNETYRKWYKKDNPNLKLYRQLKEAGVKIFVCGQSLVARGVDRNHLVPEVRTSVSMLTVMTTYQMRGYAVLKF